MEARTWIAGDGITQPRRWWVQIPGEPARYAGATADLSRTEAIAVAQRMAEAAHSMDAREQELRQRNAGKDYGYIIAPVNRGDYGPGSDMAWPKGAPEGEVVVAAWGGRRTRVHGELKDTVRDWA